MNAVKKIEKLQINFENYKLFFSKHYLFIQISLEFKV